MFPAKATSGISMAFPDVCIIPAEPQPGYPAPYPNFAKIAVQKQLKKKTGGSQVKTSGVARSSGDEAGATRGIVSQTNMSNVHYMMYSFDVKFEGKPVKALEVMQIHNGLTQLASKVTTMTTKDPNEWQKVVQDFAVLASALYTTLDDDD